MPLSSKAYSCGYSFLHRRKHFPRPSLIAPAAMINAFPLERYPSCYQVEGRRRNLARRRVIIDQGTSNRTKVQRFYLSDDSY